MVLYREKNKAVLVLNEERLIGFVLLALLRLGNGKSWHLDVILAWDGFGIVEGILHSLKGSFLAIR